MILIYVYWIKKNMDNQLCFKNPPRFDALNTSTSILWLNRTINIFNQQIFDKKKNKIKNYICKKTL